MPGFGLDLGAEKVQWAIYCKGKERTGGEIKCREWEGSFSGQRPLFFLSTPNSRGCVVQLSSTRSQMPRSQEHGSDTHQSGLGPEPVLCPRYLKADSERITIFTFGCQDFRASFQTLRKRILFLSTVTNYTLLPKPVIFSFPQALGQRGDTSVAFVRRHQVPRKTPHYLSSLVSHRDSSFFFVWRSSR